MRRPLAPIIGLIAMLLHGRGTSAGSFSQPTLTTPGAANPPANGAPLVLNPPPLVLNPPPPDDGRFPGGPNNGLVQYVALAAHNYVPGFVVPNTQFGVPYVEFTATHAALNQTATFHGANEVALVINGVVQYPLRPNKKLSPECQVVVNFRAFDPRAT